MNIPLRVKNLKKKYGTSNPFKLCKYLGILVIFADLGEIKGYSIKRMRKKLICINENLDYFSQKFVCAHELGHCLYHQLDEVNFFLKNTRIIRRSILEEEANKFAVELLYDDIDDYIENPSLDIKLLEQLRELKKK